MVCQKRIFSTRQNTIWHMIENQAGCGQHWLFPTLIENQACCCQHCLKIKLVVSNTDRKSSLLLPTLLENQACCCLHCQKIKLITAYNVSNYFTFNFYLNHDTTQEKKPFIKMSTKRCGFGSVWMGIFWLNADPG